MENEGFETPELNDKLFLHFAGFRTIENLEPYVNLKALWLESNGITKIDGLSHLKELRSLYLQDNQITVMENLEGLVNLATLNLSGNSITEIAGIATLPNLSTFNIAKNALASAESLEHLKGCPALATLDLSDNNLPGDPSNAVITVLAGVPKLVTLYLKGNPVVADTRHYRKVAISTIPALRYLDERPVFEVERISTEAWRNGGREAEAAAKKAYEEAQAQKERDSMQKFREWQEEVR